MQQTSTLPATAGWVTDAGQPAFNAEDILALIPRFREPMHLIRHPDHPRLGLCMGGRLVATAEAGAFPHVGTLPPIFPEWLGDRSFTEIHGLRFPYVGGSMANGLASAELVIALGRAGMLGFFGSAGLPLARVEAALDQIEAALGRHDGAWGANLIHSPNEPELERGNVELYLRRGVRRVEASAFMALTPNIVRYAASGLFRGPAGRICRRNHVFAKISRPEVARPFMLPPPDAMLDRLVADGALTAEEAELARLLPIAEDITAEADSGGHTDNRPLPVLLPTIIELRDRIVAERQYPRPIRIGAAGGLGSPGGVAAAFAAGAAYVLTGSVNQAAVESGLCEAGRRLLADVGMADVVMAAAADMFELGVKLQVLKRGSLFAARANRLYEIYRSYDSIEAIPADQRATLESQIFRRPLADVWEETASFWKQRSPAELAKAERDPHHRMALTFRWYLGLSSRWAIIGDPERTMDYQIWCGPAMGAFNAWVRGSFLEPPENRSAVQIARNLLEGAAVITRAQQLRSHGVPVPSSAFHFVPRPLS